MLLDVQRSQNEIKESQLRMEQQLKRLMGNENRAGPEQIELKHTHKTNEGNDRKRLKERLKKSMSEKSETFAIGHISWLEYVFGIHEANHRMGKVGSRYCLCLMPCCESFLRFQLTRLCIYRFQAHISNIDVHARCMYRGFRTDSLR